MSRMRMLATMPAAALAVVSACAPLGSLGGLGDVMNGRTETLYGEVRSVDTRRGLIQLREEHGRDYTVRYDNRTRVVYRERQYPVSALDRGDQVQVRVEYDRNNNLRTDRIDVRSSARSRDRDRDRERDRDRQREWERERDRDRRRDGGRDEDYRSGRVQQVDGQVQSVNTFANYFTMTQGRGSAMVVYVPRGTRSEDVRRFERLRRGDRVRAEVRARGNGDHAELVRFR